jgi:hypothetical protein
MISWLYHSCFFSSFCRLPFFDSSDIIEGCWAHGLFVQIALDHEGKLRSVLVEALQVLTSEDTDSICWTRLQLCSTGAAEAFGTTIKNHALTRRIEPLNFDEPIDLLSNDAEYIPWGNKGLL